MRVWVCIWAAGFVFSCASGWAAEEPPQTDEAPAVTLFLVDNAASLPPLAPDVAPETALEETYAFLKDQPYHLLTFGGRQEISVDSPQDYGRDVEWSDPYFALQKTDELVEAYPADTRFRLVLLTDGIVLPSPKDWADQKLPDDTPLAQAAKARAIDFVAGRDFPLYVLLLGKKASPKWIDEMVRAANGDPAGRRYLQELSELLGGDGLLLNRFVYRIRTEGPGNELASEIPTLKTVALPKVVGSLVVLVALLVGVGVRTFPSNGDQEILEMWKDEPVYVTVDRWRRLSSNVPAWSWRGLSLLPSPEGAAASFVLHQVKKGFPPEGLSLDGLEGQAKELIGLPLPAISEWMHQSMRLSSPPEDKLCASELQSAARKFDPDQAERILTSKAWERKKIEAVEFLHAKLHLLFNDTLHARLTEPLVFCSTYGVKGEKLSLSVGSQITLGRYTFTVEELSPGQRKDFKLVMSYERVPSPLWLKRVIPGFIQKAIRFRLTHQRVVA